MARHVLQVSSAIFGWCDWQVDERFTRDGVTKEQLYHICASGLFTGVKLYDVSDTRDTWKAVVELHSVEAIALFLVHYDVERRAEITKLAAQAAADAILAKSPAHQPRPAKQVRS